MNAVVNTTCRCKSELLLDANGDPVTTKVNGDWTKTARLLGTETTATTTITHVANGIYDITFTPTEVGNWSVEYSVVVDGETVYFDPQLVQVLTAAQHDPAAALSGVTVTSPNPVSSVGSRLTLRIGDDYNADLGNEPTWAYTGPIDLTGATVTLAILSRSVALEIACAVQDPGEATQTITAELTSEQTATLRQSQVTRYVVSMVDGDDEATLFSGKVTVLAP